MVFGITALQFHWAALRSVGSFIVVAAHLQCHVGFWMSAASTQARPLWCITKPFFTSFLLCWSIITTVAERCHTLLHGVSININVSSTNHHGWLSRCVCECMCVGICLCVGGRPCGRVCKCCCKTAECLCFTESLAPGENEKAGRIMTDL